MIQMLETAGPTGPAPSPAPGASQAGAPAGNAPEGLFAQLFAQEQGAAMAQALGQPVLVGPDGMLALHFDPGKIPAGGVIVMPDGKRLSGLAEWLGLTEVTAAGSALAALAQPLAPQPGAPLVEAESALAGEDAALPGAVVAGPGLAVAQPVAPETAPVLFRVASDSADEPSNTAPKSSAVSLVLPARGAPGEASAVTGAGQENVSGTAAAAAETQGAPAASAGNPAGAVNSRGIDPATPAQPAVPAAGSGTPAQPAVPAIPADPARSAEFLSNRNTDHAVAQLREAVSAAAPPDSAGSALPDLGKRRADLATGQRLQALILAGNDASKAYAEAASKVAGDAPVAQANANVPPMAVDVGAKTVLSELSQQPLSGVPGAERPTLQSLGEFAVKSVGLLLEKGEQTLNVRLIPESLGELKLSVRQTGDLIHVQFISANPAVREALEGQLQHLRDSFARDGIEIGKMSVSADAAGAHGQSRFASAGHGMLGDPSGRSPSLLAKAPVQAEHIPTVSDPGRRAAHTGTLNVYA